MHPITCEQGKELVGLNEKIKKQELDLWTFSRKLEAVGTEMKREESFHTKAITEDTIPTDGADGIHSKPIKRFKNELERTIELERRLEQSKSYLEMRLNIDTLKENIRDTTIELGSVKRMFKIHEILSRTGE